MPKTEIFVLGEDVSVVTSATDERDFLDQFAAALKPVMQNGAKPAEQREVVRAGFDIVAKLRGYKSEVQERRILTSGRWPHPSEKAKASAGSDDVAVENLEALTKYKLGADVGKAS